MVVAGNSGGRGIVILWRSRGTESVFVLRSWRKRSMVSSSTAQSRGADGWCKVSVARGLVPEERGLAAIGVLALVIAA